MKLQTLVNTLTSRLYQEGKYSTNTPTVAEVHTMLEKSISLFNVKNTNGNGINRKAIQIVKILNNAK